MSQSKTPRTDMVAARARFTGATADSFGQVRVHQGDVEYVSADFARALELQLNDERELFSRHVKERASELAEVERERDVYAELAANKCVIQKVTDTLGQMTLCTVAEYRSFKTRAEAAESALLQAREDAQRYRWLREQTAPFKDWKVSMTYRAEGERPERLWLHGEHLDAAIDAARQAEPQEGEKE
jgi:hypothetical protein